MLSWFTSWLTTKMNQIRFHCLPISLFWYHALVATSFHISISGMAKRCWCSIDQSLQCIVAFSIVKLLQRDTITIISIATLLRPCFCSRRRFWCCRAATAQKNSWQWKDDIILCITSSSAFQKFQDVIVMKYMYLTLILCMLC